MATLVRKADTQQEDETFLADALRVADLAAEKKAADIRGYDVRGLTFLADAFVMCTTASPPQMKAVMNAVHDGMKQAGKVPLHREGEFTSGWVLLDYGNVILHIFREEARAFYDLDALWGDAKPIDLDLD